MNTFSTSPIRHGERTLTGAAAALTLGAILSACSPSDKGPSETVRPVRTTVVTIGEEPRARTFSGRVESSRTADLTFAVPGVLVTFPVTEGQSVAKDEVIAQLRDDEFKARLTTLQGQLDQARAALRSLLAGERPEERLRRESALPS